MKKYNKCPKCGSTQLGDRWYCKGRKLQQYCCNHDDDSGSGNTCDWEGKPRIPEQKLIDRFKQVALATFSGWDYIVYDKYGHILTVSQTFESEEDATYVLNRELEKGLKNKEYGPYTGVLFQTPSYFMLEGQVFKKH